MFSFDISHKTFRCQQSWLEKFSMFAWKYEYTYDERYHIFYTFVWKN